MLLTTDDVVPIDRGGTGAITAGQARDNLQVFGLADDPASFVGTVEAGGDMNCVGVLNVTAQDGTTLPELAMSSSVASVALFVKPETYPIGNTTTSLMAQSGTVPVRVAKVDLTAQTASIASTNLLVSPTPGLYRIDVVEEDTAAAAAGTLTTTFGWTSRSGAQTASPAGTLALTGLADSDGSKVIYIASGNLTYLTTVAGVVGSPQYALSISVIRLF